MIQKYKFLKWILYPLFILISINIGALIAKILWKLITFLNVEGFLAKIGDWIIWI